MVILNLIKSKITTVLLSLVGILAVAVSFLSARNNQLKQKAAEQELEDNKAASAQTKKATEALIKGMTDENNVNNNPRDYKF